MNQLNKGKAKNISVLALILLLFVITLYCSAGGFHTSHFHSFLTVDTVPVNKTDTQKIKSTALNASSSKKITDTSITEKIDTLKYKPSKRGIGIAGCLSCR